jgi:hypothetical protein
MIDFDDRFKAGFDLANEVPLKARDVPLMTFAEPATWADKWITVTDEETGKTKKKLVLNPAFAEDWVHVLAPEVFVSVDFPLKQYTTSAFDHRSASFCDGRVKVSTMLHKDGPGLIETIDYLPGNTRERRCIGVDGKKAFNVYCQMEWKPYNDRSPPDDGPWLDFLKRVFPNRRERLEIVRWAATLVIIRIKMAYGLLLVSEEQGMGKGTLADLLGMILGMWNVSYVNEERIVGSFNDWAEKRLAICPEIYQGKSAKAYNALKPTVTDKIIEVNRKYLAPYKVTNSCEIIACSNSLRALRLDNKDRRWFVPEVTTIKQGEAYWTGFYKWLNEEDGYRKIVWSLANFLKNNDPVARGSEAPSTAMKKRVIETFHSDGAKYLIRPFELMNSAQFDEIKFDEQTKTVTLDGEVIKSEVARRLVLTRYAGIEMITLDTHARMAIKNKLYSRGDALPAWEHTAVRDAAAKAGVYTGERMKKWARDARIITAFQMLADMNPHDFAIAMANEERVKVRLADGQEVDTAAVQLSHGDRITVAVVELERLAEELSEL